MSISRFDSLLEQLAAAHYAEAKKCATCGGDGSGDGGLFRCFDCRAHFCERCCKEHFGQQHQPHPITLMQVCNLIIDLWDALEKRIQPPDMTEQFEALFWRCDEALRSMHPNAHTPSWRKGLPHSELNEDVLNSVLKRSLAKVEEMLRSKRVRP